MHAHAIAPTSAATQSKWAVAPQRCVTSFGIFDAKFNAVGRATILRGTYDVAAEAHVLARLEVLAREYRAALQATNMLEHLCALCTWRYDKLDEEIATLYVMLFGPDVEFDVQLEQPTRKQLALEKMALLREVISETQGHEGRISY